MSEVAGYEHAGIVDGFSGFAPGTMIGGNIVGLGENVVGLAKGIEARDVEAIGSNILSGADAGFDIYGAYKATKELVTKLEKKPQTLQKGPKITPQQVNNISKFIKNLK